MAPRHEVTNEQLLVRIVRLEKGLFDEKDRSRIENIEAALFNKAGENRLEEIYTLLHGLKWLANFVKWALPIGGSVVAIWKYWMGKA